MINLPHSACVFTVALMGKFLLLPPCITYLPMDISETCSMVVCGLCTVCHKHILMCRFSRKILWLKLSSTNSDPKIISRYYLETVETVGGIATVSTEMFSIIMQS